MMKPICLVLFFIAFSTALPAIATPVDDVKQVKLRLDHERSLLLDQLKGAGKQRKDILHKMLGLGLWEEAKKEIENNNDLSPLDKSLLQVDYLILNNNFKQADRLVNSILQKDKNNIEALRFLAVLDIEAWKLSEAERRCKEILVKQPLDEETSIVLGRALLLQKKYPEALTLAKTLQKHNSKLAKAYLLEADVYFWGQEPQKAEAPLITSLTLDPFNADARFSYGYAIWRRVDATQLNAMAAQWELALAINPLHFSTHWHWGNGHTNLTYADYVDQDENLIRGKLAQADSLFTLGKLEDAVAIIRQVEREFPTSVLPAMHEASLLYSDFESENRMAELEKSEQRFREVLERKKHYGPAHNGLAAVIKSKRIRYLANFDSLTNVLNGLEINDPENFKKVFPDMGYYPGSQVKAMVWNQLYTSVVYFPFLSKQENTFVIPPLHIDLAIAMNSPYFRTNTTFDNRQWMDIRGVGSGAADIGYTERGAYFERNVVLHEFVHLFHGRVLTDHENRKIRELYYHAMQNNLTLDYYSQNNESEYFAQTYPAYFESMKVHPLDFKSMNTTADLKNKDPEMYAFLERLVKKERDYLAGDQKSMASNWAQVYVNLSRGIEGESKLKAAHYLDTALQYDKEYIPAYLAYARLKQEQKEFEEARALLETAQTIDAAYAPVYAAFADLINSEYLVNREKTNVKEEQIALLKKAISLETDYQTAANLHIQLRTVYVNFSDVENAILVADHYAASGPRVSTYLRDRVNEAAAFAAAHKAFGGDASQLVVLEKLVGQHPQNYHFRGLYSDALLANGKYGESIQNMNTVQRILASTGNARPDFDLRIAEGLWALNEKDPLDLKLDHLMSNTGRLDVLMLQRLVTLLWKADRPVAAKELFNMLPKEGTPYYESLYLQSKKELQDLNEQQDNN